MAEFLVSVALGALIGILIGAIAHQAMQPVSPGLGTVTRQWIVDNQFWVELEWHRVAHRRIESQSQPVVIEIVDGLVVHEAHASVEVEKCWDPRARDYFTGEGLFLKPTVKNTVVTGFDSTIIVWFEPRRYLLETLRFAHERNN